MDTPLQPISPPTVRARRWTSVGLPSYRHVPGLTPHPVNHPDGHAYRGPEKPERPEPIPGGLPDSWRRCRPYLYGVDLFNQRYFWEAHEAWEEVWHAVGHDSTTGNFIQGLIQISAAHLKHHMEVARGVAKLLASADAHLDVVVATSSNRYMGVDLGRWRARVHEHLTESNPEFPLLVLDGDTAPDRPPPRL